MKLYYNFVDHQITDQTSVLRFIEDNGIWPESAINHLMKNLAILQICLILLAEDI